MISAQKTLSFILLLIVLNQYKCFSQVERRTIQEISLTSKVLKEKRPVLISLPTSYDQSKENYFVVYVLDGNINTSFTSGIAEILYQSGYPKFIIVGIPSTYRSRDLTPIPDREAPSGGGADNFIKFMKKELFPFIDNSYRTHDFKILVGHSYGGLFASHVLYKDPNLFNAYIAITPTVCHGNEYSLKNLSTLFKKNKLLNKTFFFSVANEPGVEGDAVLKMHEEFKLSAPPSLDWKFAYYPNENHSTTPLIATLDGLKFVFKDFQLPLAEIEKKGLKFLIDYYNQLGKKYNKEIRIPQRLLMEYGYQLMNDNFNEKAIELFNHYAKIYPNMIIPYDALSVIYEKQNKIDKAILNLEILLKLFPSYQDAIVRLNKLKSLNR